MAYGFNKKNLCKKPLRFYHCSILNLIFYQTQSEKKKQTVALAPPPLVFLNYGSAVVTFNLWKYPLIRLVFAEINFRVDREILENLREFMYAVAKIFIYLISGKG